VQGAEQFANLVGLCNRRVVALRDSRQCAFQVGSDVALGQATGDREAENLPTDLLHSMGGVQSATGLDLTYCSQHVARPDCGDNTGTERGEQVVLEPGSDLLLGRGRSAGSRF
jgi:hypothetical protein